MLKLLTFRVKQFFLVVIGLLTALVWYAGSISHSPAIPRLHNTIEQSVACHTQLQSNNETFSVFVTDPRLAKNLLQHLCANPVLNKQFDKIEVFWSNNEQEMIQFIGKGLADLALVKENIMQAFAAQSTHGYHIVASYRDYAAYLFSMKEKPKIDKEYLWGKRIGLLDYPSSRSGHIIPKTMLKELGMTLETQEIVYANSHQALRELLASGKVDIISSYWHEDDEKQFSKNYITPIKTDVSGSRWYLKMETENTDLLCAIQATLRTQSDTQSSSYYHSLYLSPDCITSGTTGNPS